MQRQIITTSIKSLRKQKGKEQFSFYEVKITLTPQPDKDNPKEENCRPVTLMILEAKIPK
jgi:hypothetical protein